MIIHLLIEDASEKFGVYKMASETFRIEESVTGHQSGRSVFRIDASEADFLYLKLKFGSKNVWKR